MRTNRAILITAFGLFSLFFGAGNLILPPYLGYISEGDWWLVLGGFCFSAVAIPIMGILAHARLQGTLFHFAEKISPIFSACYCCLVYAISIALPSPRTASVTHELAIAPFFESPPLLTSTVYFLLVLICTWYRSKVIDLFGKILTPALIIILMLIIGIAVFGLPALLTGSPVSSPVTLGILEGYQTFDAIGAVVVGGVIIISVDLKLQGVSYEEKRRFISRAGWIAGIGLFSIYAGLIFTGTKMAGRMEEPVSRTSLLNEISQITLGSTAHLLLSILVSLACFTTAVGIVTGTADFFKSRFSGSPVVYKATALTACLLGILIGQLNVEYILAIALPVLMFIYPVTIVLILLNLLPGRFAIPAIFRSVVITVIVFSIPDFLETLGVEVTAGILKDYLPLSSFSLSWVLPSIAVFFISAMVFSKKVNNP